MRYTFFWILIIGFIGSFWSCEKNDWEKDIDALRKYFDIFSPSTWISVTDKDSIVMKLGYYVDTLYSTSISIIYYDISNGEPTRTADDYYPDGYVYGNKLKFSDSYLNKKAIYPFILNDNKLILSNFRNNQSYTFYKEHDKREYPQKAILSGRWTTTMDTDSVALVFENGMMKEYVYEKTSGKIIKYTDYEKYDLFRDVYTWQGRTRSVDKIWLYNNNKVVNISKYTLSGDKLTIYKNSNPIVYTKQKP